ncbi:hypothetical protein BKA64DRAFT_685390 [Cadophora sp. MPI-SDFR-AT-0126]|nr:hypothetical protein BKA64DRAFT_685390 [Leotiomycetes sp. MPI-SDFR-AT-0126]
MSAQNQGRQSPSPEDSSDKQQSSAPSSGQGVNKETKNKEESKNALEVCLPIFFLSHLLPSFIHSILQNSFSPNFFLPHNIVQARDQS